MSYRCSRSRASRAGEAGKAERLGRLPAAGVLPQVVYVQDGRKGQARIYWEESLEVDPNDITALMKVIAKRYETYAGMRPFVSRGT